MMIRDSKDEYLTCLLCLLVTWYCQSDPLADAPLSSQRDADWKILVGCSSGRRVEGKTVFFDAYRCDCGGRSLLIADK